MTMGDICRRDVVTTGPDESVAAAVRLMRDRNVGSVVVRGAAGEPVGIVTDRDVALRVVGEALDPARTRVEAVMQRVLVTAHEEESFPEVLRRMCDRRVRRLPVVRREGGALVGIVSLDDLLRQIGREMNEVAGLLEAERRA